MPSGDCDGTSSFASAADLVSACQPGVREVRFSGSAKPPSVTQTLVLTSGPPPLLLER